MKVSRKFIREYVESLSAFGGQICKEDVVSGDYTILDTTLTANHIGEVKGGHCGFNEFGILIAGGVGWGTAWLYEDGAREEESEMEREVEAEL